jgi:hypothetical protein
MFKYEYNEIWGKCQWDNNPKVKLYQKCLLFRNYKSDSIQATQECSLDSPLQSLGFLFWYEIEDGGYGMTYFNIEPYGKSFSKRFFSETTWIIETKLPRNDHWQVLYKVWVFYADPKSKMAATAGYRLTLDPMGKCSNAFISDTTNMIKAKLYMNVHWMVLYKLGFLFRYEIQNGGYGRT